MRRERVGVGEPHGLGRARGPRGVNDGHHVCGPDVPVRDAEVEAGIAHRLHLGEARHPGAPVDRHDVLDGGCGRQGGQQPVGEGLLGDDDPSAGVAQHVRDLLDGRGVVDPEGDRADVHGGHVDPEELGPVGEHERDPVAATHAERREPRRRAPDPFGVLRPGHDDLVAHGADRHPVGVLGRGAGEGRTECSRCSRSVCDRCRPRAPSSGCSSRASSVFDEQRGSASGARVIRTPYRGFRSARRAARCVR